MNDDYKSLPFSEWLDETARAVVDMKPDHICLVAVRDDGAVLTTYQNTDTTDMAVFAHAIHQDILMETIHQNASYIKSMLGEAGGGDTIE